MNKRQLKSKIAALQDATMDENGNFHSAYEEGKFDALSMVDTLLNSLQEEPVELKEVKTVVNINKKKVTAADRGMAEEIIVNLKRIEKDYHIDLTREMEWVRNKT